jgi:hypothetical protein
MRTTGALSQVEMANFSLIYLFFIFGSGGRWGGEGYLMLNSAYHRRDI